MTFLSSFMMWYINMIMTLQARILDWVAMPSSRDLSDLGAGPASLCLLHWQAWLFWSYILGDIAVSLQWAESGKINTNSGCESWAIKEAEHWRIDAFELWCWRRLLRIPWTARRSNPSILKEISPEYSLEGLILNLTLQYFGHLMQRTDSFEKTWYWERLKAGGEGDNRGWDGWMASLTQWTWVWLNSGSWWWTGRPGVLQSMGLQSRTWQSNWTELIRGFFQGAARQVK